MLPLGVSAGTGLVEKDWGVNWYPAGSRSFPMMLLSAAATAERTYGSVSHSRGAILPMAQEPYFPTVPRASTAYNRTRRRGSSMLARRIGVVVIVQSGPSVITAGNGNFTTGETYMINRAFWSLYLPLVIRN